MKFKKKIIAALVVMGPCLIGQAQANTVPVDFFSSIVESACEPEITTGGLNGTNTISLDSFAVADAKAAPEGKIGTPVEFTIGPRLDGSCGSATEVTYMVDGNTYGANNGVLVNTDSSGPQNVGVSLTVGGKDVVNQGSQHDATKATITFEASLYKIGAKDEEVAPGVVSSQATFEVAYK